MLDNLSFRQKIITLVLFAVVGIAVIATLSVLQSRRQITEGLRGQLVTGVQSAHTIVEGFRAQAAAGKMTEAEAQRAAQDALRMARYGADGKDYYYIWTLAGAGVMHPLKPEWSGQDMVGKVKDGNGVDVIGALVRGLRNSGNGRAFVQTNFPRPGGTEPVPKLQYVIQVDGWNWMVGSGLYTDDLDVQVRQALLTNLGVGLAALLIIGGIGWMTLRSVTRQIGGDPVEAVAVMKDVANGNLAVELRHAPAGSLLAVLGEMVSSLRQTVGKVRNATDSITTASVEIASGNQDLSARTEQAASNLQQTAASMEELTSTVRHSADAARTANQLAESAASIARRGGTMVAEVVTTMDQINQSSQKISEIIGVIDGIAFQTNILALNAAVEAARAGEQGRGFAVVAAEVRNLAQRSAEAAKEIKTLIGTSVDKVDAGTRLVADAGSTMDEIVASVQRVTDIMGEISSATAEQSQGIAQVNVAVTQLDQMTQQNAALVEQSAAAAESLKDQAASLTQVVRVFRLAGAAVPG
ncbi:MAG TPA: chemotaxis protein [Hydrogenophaga sp.]|uniref:methyl-accepting chemotaxis protein n=1 Tax=Hydrogenophaga sp. TaxID=1904254 RepID=UPI0008D55626|nr:methyl-accepting chemotaxis protein [Hydrogenophaga sp.]OGA78525.1 MAG: chemotaxis protein [Burkholderiales bacterium GWE1_65_30]OGA92436.1 MAG: chemotaxis protein [Burkholderiales bacterium GWF1_66_17]HAX22246.1 chemotaxis protein [Hydrogenophaga sp.]HBU20536.1 chemotaxis protein [Hydrogenophaga sp.]